MKSTLYLLGNDVKYCEIDQEFNFTPYSGMDLFGLTGDQPVKISGISYYIKENNFKIKLSWLSAEPLTSDQLIELGWKLYQG